MTSACAAALPVLNEGAGRLGISLSGEQHAQFTRYCELLREWSAHTNVTAIRTPDGIMRSLFLDALSLVPSVTALCDDPVFLRAVDIGAGAGFPSLPLKVVFPLWSVALIESVGKKTSFLTEVVDVLKLRAVRIHTHRAEDLARQPEFRERFDLAFARAVSGLPALLELSSPFVRVGGHLVFPKSGDVGAEIESARAAERRLGLHLFRVDDVDPLLGLGEGRKIVVYVKERQTPSGYPRRTGLAQSRPIHD